MLIIDFITDWDSGMGSSTIRGSSGWPRNLSLLYLLFVCCKSNQLLELFNSISKGWFNNA